MDEHVQPRGDRPGSWHHVMNRGLARRPAFENRCDTRFFLSLLARRVRAGQIEVHAYTVLTTHFHLLLRSPRGELSQAMMWIESKYVRWFNRRRERDGPLFRARFTSRRVDSDLYWRTLVRYIDHNSVAAGITPRASDYPYSSAWHYHRSRGPIWLARKEIEAFVRRQCAQTCFDPGAYGSVFGGSPSSSESWLIERGTSRSGLDPAELLFDDLIAAAPPKVREWMRQQALIADRVRVGFALVSPETLQREIERIRAERRDVQIRTASGRAISALDTISAGLQRDVCALAYDEIGKRLRVSRSTAAARAKRHKQLLLEDRDYCSWAADVVGAALRASVRRG